MTTPVGPAVDRERCPASHYTLGALDRAIGAQPCPDWERCPAPHHALVALDRAIGAQSCPD